MATSVQALLTDTFSLRRASVVADPEFPSDILPIIYGDLTGGKGGVSYCPGIVESTFTYLIADHEIVSAANGNTPTFYSDNVIVVPASWNHADTVAGQTAATVTFSGSLAGTRIGYRGMGKAGSGGALITNPASVIEDLLTTVIGLAPTDFDTTALATARARAGSYLCAGILEADRSPAVTVSEILACFGGYYYITPDGVIVLAIDDGTTPQMPGLAGHLRAHECENAEASWTRTDVINQVAVNFTRNHYDGTLQQRFQEVDDGSSTFHAASQLVYGASGPGVTEAALEFPWCRDLTTVQAVQSVIVARLATPRAKIRVSVPTFRLAHLDVGDYVGYSWPRLYDEWRRPLVNQIGIVEDVSVDPDTPKVDLTIRDTGSYLLDGSVRNRRDYY